MRRKGDSQQNLPSGPPHRVTRQELRWIARNTEASLQGNRQGVRASIARMNARMVLRCAGVPIEDQPMAAAEASFRAALAQEKKEYLTAACGGRPLLWVVPPERLGRDPFPERFMVG